MSYHSLAQLAEASDVIVVALSLTSQTRHLIDASLLRHLRPGRSWSTWGGAPSWTSRP